ncbi:DUF2752 domain-containing protein [Pontibacter sp. HSC-14F20]|uniref:DUF2752 domain-containing protein n=1 Tax=Pontibacter sp. HSC-14F20 TaxID=2864136 RepID=UPI001C72E66A|nr:DUF2752 domain-containing protein [Pontibacter sp. HSC-14F20]
MAIIQKSYKQQLISKEYWSIAKVLSLAILPLALLFLPTTFFDEGQSVCLSVLLADTTCYGCGMTRAIMHLIHFNLEAALTFNKLSLIVLPLLIYVWGQSIYRDCIHLHTFYRSNQRVK